MTEIQNSDLKILDSHISTRQNQIIDLIQECVNILKTQNKFNEQAVNLIKAMENIEYPIPKDKPITEKNIKAPETGQVTEPEKKDGFYQ